MWYLIRTIWLALVRENGERPGLISVHCLVTRWFYFGRFHLFITMICNPCHLGDYGWYRQVALSIYHYQGFLIALSLSLCAFWERRECELSIPIYCLSFLAAVRGELSLTELQQVWIITKWLNNLKDSHAIETRRVFAFFNVPTIEGLSDNDHSIHVIACESQFLLRRVVHDR